MQSLIYADLRCLQDLGYRPRGIGYHTSALLRARRHSSFRDWKAVGLIDPKLPELPPEVAALVDEITPSVNPLCNGVPQIFLDGSPMTHDTRFSLRFINHPAFLRAAVLYDFIPLDWPGYLPNPATRIEYLAKVARLRKFDLFFPISEYTAWRASELAGISRIRMRVTGACVRNSIYEHRESLRAAPPLSDPHEEYFVTVGGDDMRRKNTEIAVRAVRHLNLIYARRIWLKVVGHYEESSKRNLLQLAGHREGKGFLQFCPAVSDEDLVILYNGAIATIAPSHIEGFSLPVAEASACGCPVVASTCAAHIELIDQPEALFPSDDGALLCQRLDALLNDRALRDSLIASQSRIGARFREDAVGRRFWSTVEAAVESRPGLTAVSTRKKPRLAFLSPFPPDQSGCALYTAMTMRAGTELFDSDLYTDAPRPLTFEGRFRDSGGISAAPLIARAYNGVVSVIGNSHFHFRIFDIFERYGGPCILHDARLTNFFFHHLGQEEFLKFAAKLLGRSVCMEEVHPWLLGRNLPSLFLDAIVERASPLIVHTATQQAEIKKRYTVDAHVATCCPTVSFTDDELSRASRQAARERHGISPNAFLVSSFGYVSRLKAMEVCILAVELLRSWNIPAELYFVGDAGGDKDEVNRIAALYGIAEHVHVDNQFVDDSTYRDFLVASDAGLQLRTYGFGQFSAALADCISAGLPTVANSDLAASCAAPAYASTVPDWFSPLQVAEQLATIWENRTPRESYIEARRAYLQKHNFEYYGKRLIEILGIA